MIPSDPKRQIIDPRRLVREHGREALAELVALESGYIFQLRPLKDLCQALKSGMPLLAEGERGGGKTEMVDALAHSCNRPYFELQGMDDLTLKDVERDHIVRILSQSSSFMHAATTLGIDMATLWRKRRRYEIDHCWP